MSYPRIEFVTSKRNVSQTTAPWRDKILVVDEFNKGPAEVVEISGNNFEEFFGVDSSSGSSIVQQILSTGASNIAVSRAVPEDTPSKTSISLASGNITEVEPVVGYEVSAGEYNVTINEVDYTIGLAVDVKYIGSPIVQRTLISPVYTKDTDLVHPAFAQNDELGLLDFTVIDFKEGVETPEVKHPAGGITVNVATASIGEQQVVKIAKAVTIGTNDIDVVDQAIQPGYVFEDTAEKLLILSKPFSLSADTWGVLVENLTDTTAGNLAGVEVKDPEDSYYILGYRLGLREAAELAVNTVGGAYHKLPGVSYITDYVNEPLDGCLAVKVATVGVGGVFTPVNIGVFTQFKYQVIDTAVVTDPASATAYALTAEAFGDTVDNGVQLMFGEVGSADPIALLKGGKFSVPLASGYITVGSDDEASELAYTVGTSAKQIMTDLYEKILGSEAFSQLFENVDLATDFIPYTISMETILRGVESNRVKYSVDRFAPDTVYAASADATTTVAGKSYKILTVGTTDFTTIGASSSTVGEVFVATGAGAGTGTVALVKAADIQLKVDKQDFSFRAESGYVTLSGGFDGPRYGFKDFYALDGQPVIRVQAVSPGIQDIKVSISPESVASRDSIQFKLTVETRSLKGLKAEVLTLNTKNVSTDTGLFVQSASSPTVRVYFLPFLQYRLEELTQPVINSLTLKAPARIAPPLAFYSSLYAANYAINRAGAAVLKAVSLTGGSNFNLGNNTDITAKEVRKQAYLSALRRIEYYDAAFVVLSGLAYGDPAYAEVFEEAIRQVSDADVENGLRQLFLETPANMTGKQAELLSSSINNRYISLVNGRITQALLDGGFSRQVSTLGYYAGLTATRPPQLTVHAALAGQRLNGISTLNVKSTKQFKTQVTDGRVDTMYFDNGLRSYKFLNGLTTSSVAQDRYMSVNRIRIQVISDLYQNLQWVRSLPNTAEIRGQVETAVNAYMQTKQKDGWFLAIGAIICNDSNNSNADVLAGRLNLQLSYVPVLPADFVFVDLIEDYTLIDTITLPTAA